MDKVKKMMILKKTVPALVTWLVQWFGEEPHPDTGVGGNWKKKFFKDCKVFEDTYTLSHSCETFDSNAGRFTTVMKVTFEIYRR